MRQRLITAFFGILLAVVILCFYNTVVLNIAMALVTFLALYEALISTGLCKYRSLFAICAVFGVSVPFFDYTVFRAEVGVICYVFISTLFVFLLFHHKTVRVETIGAVFLFTLLISCSFSCLVFLKDLFKAAGGYNIGLFYICLTLIGAWVTDAGGYFFGRFFGRHKLSPTISPKKTVEGAVGGLVCTVFSFLVAAIVYQKLAAAAGVSVSINYLSLMTLSVICVVAAVLGDLSASLLKRDCHLKDFGNVIPGHGGILDRFDSVLLVAPAVYFMVQFLPVIQ